MRFKKVTSILSVGIISLSLAACSQPEPKKAYTDAYTSLLSSTSYQFQNQTGLHLTFDGLTDQTEEQKNILHTINNASFSLTGVYDKKQKKIESTLHSTLKTTNSTVDFTLPTLVNEKKDTIYVKADDLTQLFNTLLPVKGDVSKKLVAVPIQKPQGITIPSETLHSVVEKEVTSFVSNLDKTHFTREEVTKKEKKKDVSDKIELTLNEKEVKTLVNTILDKLKEKTTEQANKDQIEALRTSFSHYTVKEFTATLSFDKKHTFVNEAFDVSLQTKDENGKVTSTFGTEIDTTYKNLNEPVTFKIKPSSKNSVPFAEAFSQPTE